MYHRWYIFFPPKNIAFLQLQLEASLQLGCFTVVGAEFKAFAQGFLTRMP